MGENADTVISNICIYKNVIITFRYPHPYYMITIRIRAVIAVSKCYYLLSAYEVTSVLDYYLNLYAILNNTVVII
jgi:hypothetical protein